MMNRPAGSEGDGGPDLFDALQDIKKDLRKEFESKLDGLRDALMKKIKELERKDKEQQDALDWQKSLLEKHEN